MRKKKNAPPRTVLAVSVSVVGDRDATTAWASMLGGHYTADMVQAAGSAKRRAGDMYNEKTAWDLAVGRALVELGLQLQGSGEARVLSDAATHAAEMLQAGIRRTERAMRGSEPRTVLPLSEVLSEHGLLAAQRAAERRGEEQQLEALVRALPLRQGELGDPHPPEGRHRRDNGLPTIETGTGKDTK